MGTTFDELILSAEVEKEQAEKRKERALATVKLIHEKARQEARARLSEDEDGEVAAAMEAHKRADGDVKGVDAKLANLKVAKATTEREDLQLAERSADPKAAPAKRAYDQTVRVGQEERTYHRGQGKGGTFLRDVIRQHLYRDLDSEQRLIRHMQEERVERGQYLERAVGTGAFAGVTVPQYLTEMYAPAVAARRPFADACNKHDLPADGMTVNISRITTASGVALQATENTAVQNTDMDDTLLTENVQTAAGQQTISRQAIDRGTGVEAIAMDDLFRRYATALDSTLLNQAVTGLSAAAAVNAYTDATPTFPELYPKLLGAAAGVEAALLGFAAPDLVVMSPRRWYWLQSQMTTAWPAFAQPGIATQQFGANLSQTYGSGVRGILPNGMAVIVDANIATNLGAGTNEDEIYVVAHDECHLWEDPNAPVFIRAEQPAAASLGVLIVLYGYFAYSFRRFPAAVQKISGTGLVGTALF